ncbi:MAG: hypothetical protein AAGH64_00955 [Planctomycetota bacterium]
MTTRRVSTLRALSLLSVATIAALGWGLAYGASADVALRPVAHQDPVRFAPLDVYIDAGDERLGAWQVELAPKPEFAGRVSIVGVGGGDLPFVDAPYYDDRAIQRERVIIADFETDPTALNTGRSRVAQVQLRIEGERDPDFDIALHTAARHDGAAIDAAVEAVLGRPARSDDDNDASSTENDG